MIKLFQFPACWGIPNASPFCMKMETYLRMAKLPYEVVNVMDPRKAPKGKLPFIIDNGQTIADSSLIIDYLKHQYGDSLDANLTPVQQAQGLCIQRLIEEHLYWCMLYSRWCDAANWPTTKNVLFAKVPWWLRNLIAHSVKKAMRQDLHASGIGRHQQSEIYQMGVADLKALTTILSQHPFILGEQPTSLDACVYGFLLNLIAVPTLSPMNDYAKSDKVLLQYSEKMKRLYF